MPPADGNAFLAAIVANALRGTFPPLDLLAICLVQAMVAFCCNDNGWKCCVFTSVQVMVVFFHFASPLRTRKKFQVTIHTPLFLYF
jgi:hypothetical protein